MKNYIPVNHYKHVEVINMNGLTSNSCYNYNYYMGFEDPNDIILEECDDDGFWMYYRVNGLFEKNVDGTVKVMNNLEHIGNYANQFYGAFDEDNPDIDEFGFIEIDTEFC